MNNLPKRKQIRLSSYDYSEHGWYYITICTKNRKCILGNIRNKKMMVNDVGTIVMDAWQSLPDHHSVGLDTFQIMPNHVHFILRILPPRRGIARNARLIVGRGNAGFARKTPTFGNVTAGSLPCIIRSFKSECTKQIRRMLKNPNIIVWQRNYYENVIRDEHSLDKIRKYIQTNPQIWDRDRNNPVIHTKAKL